MDFDFENQFQKDTALQLHQNDHQDGYYQEYCRLFLANIALTNQVKDLIQQKNMLRFRLGKYQDDECFSSYERNQKSKRFRRNAHQIQRFYKCTVRSCSKSYGSQGSLNQHYKLKHPEIYATLPNVQPLGSSMNQNMSEHSLANIHSNSNVSNILRELGSYKSIKLEQIYCKEQISELSFEKQNKDKDYGKSMKQNQHFHSNITQLKSQNGKREVSLKKQQSIQTTNTMDSSIKLKRSSRQIKKRDINF